MRRISFWVDNEKNCVRLKRNKEGKQMINCRTLFVVNVETSQYLHAY